MSRQGQTVHTVGNNQAADRVEILWREHRKLRGVAIYSNAPALAELAGCLGFETVWIDLEHGSAGFGSVEELCRAAEAGGGCATVRVPDAQRSHILRALEAGARIVVVPMVNDAGLAREVVRHGKFPPLGERGFNVRSRGLGYGLQSARATFAAANTATHLFVQVETSMAVENLAAICEVDGLSGIFIGPGDLSASLGCTGDFDNDLLIETTVRCVRQARDAGLHAGILAPQGRLLRQALLAGCDLCICGGDVPALQSSWAGLLRWLDAEGEEP
jgi:4-hydroxy-2-oxoheptanedioate aldolase